MRAAARAERAAASTSPGHLSRSGGSGRRRVRALRHRRSELVTGALVTLSIVMVPVLATAGPEHAATALALGFAVVLVAAAWSDVRRRLIPNRLTYPALGAVLTLTPLWPGRGSLDALIGGLAALAVALAIRRLSAGGLGGGDVKLAALAGALGYPHLALVALLTVLSGGAAAVILLGAGLVGRRSRLAYGPFIAIGGIAGLLA